MAETANRTLEIRNRKYLGSKARLLPFIERIILDTVIHKQDENPPGLSADNTEKPIGHFVDLFAGTGVVGHHFRRYSRHVTANDILFSNYVINHAYLASDPFETNPDTLKSIITECNTLTPQEGYAFYTYGGTYFTLQNAGKIDSVRNYIEALYSGKTISTSEYYILLTSLLYAADKTANTIGQYDAFLKHLGTEPYSSDGTHKVDAQVYIPLTLRIPDIECGTGNTVYNRDANELARNISCDVLYLDPPYNTRQYIDCYHVLENIMRWEKPEVFGKTCKFRRNHLKSSYSSRRKVTSAFAGLIESVDARHIFLSYNSEGIMDDKDIIEILQKRGPTEIFKHDYSIFGNGAGQSKKRPITERIFYCRPQDNRPQLPKRKSSTPQGVHERHEQKIQ